MLKKGDVVAGLPKASQYYSKTKSGTQWIIYDVEFDNILLGRVVPSEKYKQNQRIYDKSGDKYTYASFSGYHWVQSNCFKFVHSLNRDTNEDALDLLIDDAMSFLIPKEMVK